jgi:hypothetical protein
VLCGFSTGTFLSTLPSALTPDTTSPTRISIFQCHQCLNVSVHNSRNPKAVFLCPLVVWPKHITDSFKKKKKKVRSFSRHVAVHIASTGRSHIRGSKPVAGLLRLSRVRCCLCAVAAKSPQQQALGFDCLHCHAFVYNVARHCCPPFLSGMR